MVSASADTTPRVSSQGVLIVAADGTVTVSPTAELPGDATAGTTRLAVLHRRTHRADGAFVEHRHSHRSGRVRRGLRQGRLPLWRRADAGPPACLGLAARGRPNSNRRLEVEGSGDRRNARGRTEARRRSAGARRLGHPHRRRPARQRRGGRHPDRRHRRSRRRVGRHLHRSRPRVVRGARRRRHPPAAATGAAPTAAAAATAADHQPRPAADSDPDHRAPPQAPQAAAHPPPGEGPEAATITTIASAVHHPANLPELGRGVRANIVRAAAQQIGWPYVWGGESRTEGGFDCSGLVDYAYSAAGHALPGRPTAAVLWQMGIPIAKRNLRPGDLVFLGTYSGAALPRGHVRGARHGDRRLRPRAADRGGAAGQRALGRLRPDLGRRLAGAAASAAAGAADHADHRTPTSRRTWWPPPARCCRCPPAPCRAR